LKVKILTNENVIILLFTVGYNDRRGAQCYITVSWAGGAV